MNGFRLIDKVTNQVVVARRNTALLRGPSGKKFQEKVISKLDKICDFFDKEVPELKKTFKDKLNEMANK